MWYPLEAPSNEDNSKEAILWSGLYDQAPFDKSLGGPVYARQAYAYPQESSFFLLAEKERLEGEIAVLKSQKDRYSEDVYYEQLESLLISLATLNERIEKLKFP